MNKRLIKVACFVMISGAFLFVASLASFGFSIWRVVAAKTVLTVQLEPDKKTITDQIKVNTKKYCMVSVTTDFESSSVQEEEEFNEANYKPRYYFPVSYKVLDAEGKTLFEEKRDASWNAESRIVQTHNEQADINGGVAIYEHYFTKFKVPAPGVIKVEVEVKPDTTYEAKIKNLELKIYDNVSKHTGSILSGCCLNFLGIIIFGAGIILLIIGAIGNSKKSSG